MYVKIFVVVERGTLNSALYNINKNVWNVWIHEPFVIAHVSYSQRKCLDCCTICKSCRPSEYYHPLKLPRLTFVTSVTTDIFLFSSYWIVHRSHCIRTEWALDKTKFHLQAKKKLTKWLCEISFHRQSNSLFPYHLNLISIIIHNGCIVIRSELLFSKLISTAVYF